MIKSMTGYGKAEATIGSRKFTVELRSLNSKQFDLNVRMPSVYKEKEMKLRNWLSKEVVRGKADLGIYYDADSSEKRVTLNKALIEAYHTDMKAVAKEIGQDEVDYMSLIMRIPDVLRPEKEELNEEEWGEIMKLIKEANTMFQGYRSQEGDGLQKDFEERIGKIMQLDADLDEAVNARIKRIKDRIRTNLDEVIDPDKVDQNRFEQEVVYYLEKIDVTEERVRLSANCNYFLEILRNGAAQGKKLGFISQEIGREINTLGSKANDSDIQRVVVQMKDELEKIKEQVLNVL
ncbi:MAG: YicC family protein [Flavobacteriales bacterium]|nr:YicC family protein [Flavobacteriales bacterium]MDG1780128.1 YicC family protein [Flavobacteriales bacterium]MDG2246833.1 YicC family protein [Flavobacteriales bacterium]